MIKDTRIDLTLMAKEMRINREIRGIRLSEKALLKKQNRESLRSYKGIKNKRYKAVNYRNLINLEIGELDLCRV